MLAAHNGNRSPRVDVEIAPGRASVDILIGALDATLRSPLPGLRVWLAVGADDARRSDLEALCGSDPRVELGAMPARSERIAVRLPARARPQPRTLVELAAVVELKEPARVVVRLPGLDVGRLVAEGTGSGSIRLKPREIDLRSVSSRRAQPLPVGDLAHERAEHLRHRARGSTLRARVDRNQHRLSRERLQVRHERARLWAAEERLGGSSTGEWVRWRSRALGRRARGLPAGAAAIANQARAYGKRVRRFTGERWRSSGRSRAR